MHIERTVPKWRRLALLGVLPLVAGLAAAFSVIALEARPTDPARDPATDPAYGNRELLEHGSSATYRASQTSLTSSLRSFTETVRLGAHDEGRTFDRTVIWCHGGVIQVRWHVGNLEPTVPDTGIHLSARLDGEPIGGILRGHPHGIWGDAPAGILAIEDCAPGAHVVDLQVVAITGGWGFPYVANVDDPAPDGLVVNRGFVVTEYWDAPQAQA